MIGPSQSPLPDNTQHTLEADIHAPSGIRTLSLASERPQTHALDRPPTGICRHCRLLFYCIQFDFDTVLRKRAFVVDVLTRLRADRCGVRFTAEAGDLYPPKRADRLWGSPSLLFSGYHRLFPRE